MIFVIICTSISSTRELQRIWSESLVSKLKASFLMIHQIFFPYTVCVQIDLCPSAPFVYILRENCFKNYITASTYCLKTLEELISVGSFFASSVCFLLFHVEHLIYIHKLFLCLFYKSVEPSDVSC